MNHFKKLLSPAHLYRRQVARSASGFSEVPARFYKLRLKQKQFDPCGYIPVHLRRFSDRILFGTSCVLIAGGLFMPVKTFWNLVVKDL